MYKELRNQALDICEKRERVMAARAEVIPNQARGVKTRKRLGFLRWIQTAYERVNMPPQAMYAEDQQAAHRILKY